MNLTNYEAEDTASVYTHSRALRRKLDKLSAERPEDCKLFRTSHDGQAAEFYIPKKWIKISPPRKISAAQRETLEKARQSKNKAV